MVRPWRGADDSSEKGARRRATSGCRQVLAELDPVSTEAARLSGIRSKLRRGFDEGQSAEGNAGLHKAVPVMNDVGRDLPAKIPQVPFDGQARIVAQQDFGRVYRFCGSSQLGERRRAYRKRLEMVGIHIKLFARPGQRSVILPEHVVAER